MSKLDFLWKPSAAHPVHAAIKAHKKDGNVLNAIVDPSGRIYKQPMTEKQGEKWIAKERAKKKKERLGMKAGGKVKGYKHGGQTCCRGMGAATRGGNYSKNG